MNWCCNSLKQDDEIFHLRFFLRSISRSVSAVQIPFIRNGWCMDWLFILVIISATYRSSRLELFSRNAVLRNSAKFTGTHLCQSLFFKKVAGLRPAILLKKRLWHRCFPVNFAKLLRTPFLTEHLRWLIMDLQKNR